MSTAPQQGLQPQPGVVYSGPGEVEHQPTELIIFSHSMFFYWWPVWVTGYVMALLTWAQGVKVTIGNVEEHFHPSKNPGVIFTAVFLMVIIFTHVTLRGMASMIVVLSVLLVVVLLAYLGWWEEILAWLPYLSIHMNLGFYLIFSSAIFLLWALSFFGYDRLRYWRVRPGQLIQETVIGGATKSYDTRGMVFEKRYEDLFRHWLLGLGSGDIRITTGGSHSEELVLPNVLFVDAKVRQIQQLIAVQPDVVTPPPASGHPVA